MLVPSSIICANEYLGKQGAWSRSCIKKTRTVELRLTGCMDVKHQYVVGKGFCRSRL
jgi:hypothetical protein